MTATSTPSVFIAAGEVSGDALGAALITALRARCANIRIAGIGGTQMTKQGIDSLFPIEDIAVMGVLPVIPRLPNILRRVRQTLATIKVLRPDVIVLIDSPEFMHYLARRIRRHLPDIPIICYVAPQIWAWRRGRARKMRAYCDAILALLPFEPDIFAAEGGPPCHFIGHPVVERMAQFEPVADFRATHNIAPDTPLLCLLPGSRALEIKNLMPHFSTVVTALAERIEGLQVCVPVVAHVGDDVKKHTTHWSIQPIFVYEEAQKWAAFKAATAALAASGTVSLELALAQVPMVVAYELGFLTNLIAPHIVRVPSVVLSNLILDKPIVPEFLGDYCTPQHIMPALYNLLTNETANRAMREELAAVKTILRPDASASPAELAAQIVLEKLP